MGTDPLFPVSAAEYAAWLDDLRYTAVPIVVKDFTPVGSRWTCDPAPTDTDEDWLVLVDTIGGTTPMFCNGLDVVRNVLVRRGWECNASYEQEQRAEADFLTARNKEVNLIIYNDPVGYGKFLGAARICKELNLLDKRDRVRLHRAATEHDWFDKGDAF